VTAQKATIDKITRHLTISFLKLIHFQAFGFCPDKVRRSEIDELNLSERRQYQEHVIQFELKNQPLKKKTRTRRELYFRDPEK
jgi:hypothetical protein